MELQHQQDQVKKPSEKQSFEQVDYVPSKLQNSQKDYTGAAAKTDPAEIALVRKLDMNILVRRVRKC